MSEEKLYMVKNDDGEYWDFNYADFWRLETAGCYETTIKVQAEIVAKERGGHIVTLIEEPEKVVLTKEQAEIVDEAHIDEYPATYISDNTGMCDDDNDEIMLMKAYVNGYTVEKDKKYYVKVPHTDDSYFYKVDGEYCNAGDSYYLEGMTDKKWFTDAEIEYYGLQDCERVESD